VEAGEKPGDSRSLVKITPNCDFKVDSHEDADSFGGFVVAGLDLTGQGIDTFPGNRWLAWPCQRPKQPVTKNQSSPTKTYIPPIDAPLERKKKPTGRFDI
jgi:hypothetical protein